MFKKKNRVIVCADGFRMSVQANQGAYCSPRDDCGPYTEAEIGFPTMEEPLLTEYAEDPNRPTDTVYGWVPRDRILMVIAKHGGLVEGDLPEGMTSLWEKQ